MTDGAAGPSGDGPGSADGWTEGSANRSPSAPARRLVSLIVVALVVALTVLMGHYGWSRPSDRQTSDSSAPLLAAATEQSPVRAATPSGFQWMAVMAETGQLAGTGGLCLAASDHGTARGDRIQAGPCTAGKAQTWTFGVDGTLRAHGLCARAAGAAAGATVGLSTCDGTTLESWQFDTADELINHGARLCLTNPSPAAGTRLRVSACADTTNQRWIWR